MKIIPVIDILKGKAVHAVRGKRTEYQSVKSVLCGSAEPLEVACAFANLSFKELYVADLDAIMGKGENFGVLKQIAEKSVLKLWVDAGVADLETAKKVFQSGVSKAVLGTETLPNLNFLEQAIDNFGWEKIVVSLDLKEGKVLSRSQPAASMNALELACKIQESGVCELIVLDLARVGSGEGVDFALLRELRSQLSLKLFVGGGIRDTDDLLAVKNLGVDGVLLASALHSGKISITALQRDGLI